jgi:hypothetical protein
MSENWMNDSVFIQTGCQQYKPEKVYLITIKGCRWKYVHSVSLKKCVQIFPIFVCYFPTFQLQASFLWSSISWWPANCKRRYNSSLTPDWFARASENLPGMNSIETVLMGSAPFRMHLSAPLITAAAWTAQSYAPWLQRWLNCYTQYQLFEYCVQGTRSWKRLFCCLSQ